MDATDYKTIEELDILYPKGIMSRESKLYEDIKFKLINNGFGNDLSSLSSFLKKNPKFLEHCNYIQAGLSKHKTILVLIDDSDLLWDIHNYFPILYALNNKGAAVYRTTIKILLDNLLDKEVSTQLSSRLYKDLVILSNIFSGDNRLASLSPSVEGLIEPILHNRKIMFTATTAKGSFSEAKKNAMYKLRTFYSQEMEQTFSYKVAPLFIQTRESKKSLWED